MRKLLPLLFLISTISFGAYQIIPEQLSIGVGKPDVSASLHLTGVEKGFLPNRLTTTQRNAIASPATGLMIYNTTLTELQIYNGVGWATVGAGGAGGIDAWSTATVYAVDDVVIFNQEIYLCLISHTSGVFATDLANGNWVIVSDDVSSTGVITDLSIPKFVGTSGNIISSSDVLIDASNNITGAASLAIGGSLDASSIFDLTSTTKGSKPCPSMTEAQRDLIATPATGLCVFNTTSNALNIYDGVVWKGVGGGISNWETSKAYKIDDVVIESNKIYQAETDHTSGTFATDLANGDWVEISAMEVVDLATADVTGVLPIANGGTNSSTVLTNSKVIESRSGAIQESLVGIDASGGLTVPTDITLSDAQFNSVEIGHQLAHTVNTGVENGAILSIDTDTTKFDLSAQNLTFSDYTANSDMPIIKEVDCPALDAQTVTNIASADVTYILVADDCSVTQQTVFPTPQERRLKAFIGRVAHPNRITISTALSTPDFLAAPISQLYDLVDAIGAFNLDGNIISANGANLSLNKTSGTIFRRSSNYVTDDQNPHEPSTPSLTLAQFFRATQNAIGATLFTTLDVANYDLAGTITAIGGGANSSTNQRVYLGSTNRITVQYGQVVYSSLSAAISGIPNESFVPNTTLKENTTLLAVISCVKGATDLTDSSQCVISRVSRFDTSGISAGTGGTTNLQQAYNNSVTPQITTSSTGGSVDIRRGSAADTDAVLTSQNGSGTQTSKIQGDGKFIGSYQTPSNMAVNGDVELTDISAFTCTVGTCTRTTTSGEFSQGVAALKVALSAQAMNVSQTVSTPSGIQKQGFVRVIYRVPSTMTDFQVCTLVDAAEQTCVPTANLVKDDTFRSIEIPLTFGSTSAGIKFKTTSTFTANAYFDGVIISQGLGVQNINLNTTQGASISNNGTTASITSQSGDWISSVSRTGTGVIQINFKSGVFTVAPKVDVSMVRATVQDAVIQMRSQPTTSSVTVEIRDNDGILVDFPIHVGITKQGNDYLAASASAYTQNLNKTISTTVFSFLSSTTGSVSQENIDWINGNASGSTSPYTFTFNSGIFTVAPNCVATTDTAGGNTTTAVQVSSVSSSQVVIKPFNTSTGAARSDATFWVFCQKQGADYENAFNPFIVGSFENVPQVPSAGARIDTFSFSYGTTNATTICSASPCSYLDQIGNAVTSVTRASTGLYTSNFARTYTRVKCTISVYGATLGVFVRANLQGNNVSSLSWETTNNIDSADVDTRGTLVCQGTY